MKKLFIFVLLAAWVLSGNTAKAQVSESPEWASRIKAEGLSHSQIEEIAQYLTDLTGSRLTASKQKRRADSLVIVKLKELGLSNPRAAFSRAVARAGWDVVQPVAAMPSP